MTDPHATLKAIEGTRAYFDKGRCSGHSQFNGRYCRDVAGPEQWCIHCAGFMLLSALTDAHARAQALEGEIETLRESIPTEALIEATKSSFPEAQDAVAEVLRLRNLLGRVQLAGFDTRDKLRARAEAAEREVEELSSENDRLTFAVVAEQDKFTAEQEKQRRLREALSELRINANRLCDRSLGGSYEDDCRLSLKRAETALGLDRRDK
jgi:hypothetical protein